MNRYEIAELKWKISYSNEIRKLQRQGFVQQEVNDTEKSFSQNLDELCIQLESLTDDVAEFVLSFPNENDVLYVTFSRFSGEKKWYFTDDFGLMNNSTDIAFRLLRTGHSWEDFHSQLIKTLNYL